MSQIFHENCAFEKDIMEESFECPALNLTILPKKRGYALHYPIIKHYFDEDKSKSVLKTIEESYFLHFYSHDSDKYNVTTNSTSAYAQIAKNSCPGVFKSSGEFFK